MGAQVGRQQRRLLCRQLRMEAAQRLDQGCARHVQAWRQPIRPQDGRIGDVVDDEVALLTPNTAAYRAPLPMAVSRRSRPKGTRMSRNSGCAAERPMASPISAMRVTMAGVMR